jgi:thiol-disulfide isomerase/thioredoxin
MRRLFMAGILAIAVAACADSNDAAWPDVDVLLPSGSWVAADELRGDDTTVVSLWSIWCEPCRRELPQLQLYASGHPDVAVVALNLGDTPEAVTDYAAELGLTLPIAIDDKARISSALSVTTVPATVVIDRRGNVVARHLGEISADSLAELVGSGS